MAVHRSPIVSIDRALRWPAIECTGGGCWHIAREGPAASAPAPRLLDAVRNAAPTRHLSRRTEKAYVAWVRRDVGFHGERHPRALGSDAIRGS